MWSYAPSFRRQPESRACSHMHRHSGSPIRHSGESRNLWRAVTYTVIPAPAGIQGLRSHTPSFRLPHPSFRRKPESRACGHIHRHSGSPIRHSGESRNLWRAVICTTIPAPQPPFRRQPASRACGHIHRHSGESRNLWPAVTYTVIPACAGIYGVRSYAPSFRRKPESMLAGSIIVAGDYDARFRRKPE